MLGEQDDDHCVHNMKCKMLESLNIRFADIEDVGFLALATLLDPRYKENFFSSTTSRQCAKEMLLSEYTYFLEETESAEPSAKRIATGDEGPIKQSKLWGCLSEIISESAPSSSEETTHNVEIDQYISAPLLDFKHGHPLRWWQGNCQHYPILARIARKYLSVPSTSVC